MKLPLNNNNFLYLINLTIVVFILEIFSHFGINIPFPYSPIIYSIFILTSGWKILINGIESLFKFNFGSINLLILIVILAAYYLGDYTEAAAVIVLYALGEKLENTGIENSLSTTNRLINNIPKTVLVKNVGYSIPIDTIKVGTIIQIEPYKQIPLDGIIEKGETLIDESFITGELLPVFKTKGDNVFAGTWNKNREGSKSKGNDEFIEIRTTKEYKDSIFSKIVSLVKEPHRNQSNAQKFIEKFARIYTPIVIFCAILLIIIPVFFLHRNFQQCLHQSIMLLIISCPCALVISTPVAIYAALGNASSKGALIKGGKFLEILALIKVVGLNKTGTITYGEPIISDIIPLNGISKEELFNCRARTELLSKYPLAQTIVKTSKKEDIIPHKGIIFENIVCEKGKSQGTICKGKLILVGKSFIEKNYLIDKETREIINKLSIEGKTSVIISCEEKIKGIFGLSDEVRPHINEIINELQNMGIKIVIITSDNQQSTQYVADRLHIKNVFGELLPYDKVERIKELKQRYKYVAMISDEVNDLPALASSSVGIAIGTSGSDKAIEVADIVLMNNKLSLLPFLIRLAQKTLKTIRWNTFGAIATKFIFILLTFIGYNNLVLAITADVGITLVVVLISLRLIQYRFHDTTNK
jgi:Cd2+/Zn2+-exporting ATPase